MRSKLNEFENVQMGHCTVRSGFNKFENIGGGEVGRGSPVQ